MEPPLIRRRGVRPGAGARGFTLVEVLIATAILAALLALAAAGYSAFLKAWARSDHARFDELEQFRLRWLITAAIEGSFDYYVTARDPQGLETKRPYFIGTSSELRFVTLSSVQRKGFPAMARLLREGGVEGKPARVVYEETVLDRGYLKEWDDHLEPDLRLVLFDGVEDCSFRYYGPVRRTFSREEDRFVTESSWSDRFDARALSAMPSLIRLSFSERGVEHDVLYHVRSYNPFKADKYSSPEM
ncbi:MAG: prepilin-type N-terminal cleavage/methylation domain-containing protein [Deltaproteobacteria bacterium]|nr:prepilin-type N-terminal cleavage/methylation domain-containing protein [Deltaproteobacteria bacterium]